MSTGKMKMPDRTQEAVRQQVEAMGAEVFEVGVFDSVSERMVLRTWDKATAVKSIPWLRFENLKGRNIYVRPAGIHSLSLVDDLSADALHRMRREGFTPALVVETSPRNFQAWLRHDRTLDKALSTAAAKALAREFHGDQGSADWRHFGRLAGFTNRKEKYRLANGHFPYVRLIEATGAVYERAQTFVQEVEDRLKGEVEETEAGRRLFRMKPRRTGLGTKPIEHFRNDSKYAGAQSRSDMAYAVYALDHAVSEDAVRAAIASQDLSFKGSPLRQSDYVNRIIDKAQRYLRSHGMRR